MISLRIQQSWLEKSSDSTLEYFKTTLLTTLNPLVARDATKEPRWSISKISEGNAAHLLYDEKTVGLLRIKDGELLLETDEKDAAHDDEIMYAARAAAQYHHLAVHSLAHKGARLPQRPDLLLDFSLFTRNKALKEFFDDSNYTPRFAIQHFDNDDGRQSIRPPFYVERKKEGTIYIINPFMLLFLVQKAKQKPNREFAYKVADSMDDFAKKYDVGLIPTDFYQNYGQGVKIINDTRFDIVHLKRKVFIDPYLWDFDSEHDPSYYANLVNGLHLMDKVRKGEKLDDALKRILHEEFKVAKDYIGARIWGIEFDRDKEGNLTPRLKINIFVHGLAEKQRHQEHDWKSV